MSTKAEPIVYFAASGRIFQTHSVASDFVLCNSVTCTTIAAHAWRPTELITGASTATISLGRPNCSSLVQLGALNFLGKLNWGCLVVHKPILEICFSMLMDRYILSSSLYTAYISSAEVQGLFFISFLSRLGIRSTEYNLQIDPSLLYSTD